MQAEKYEGICNWLQFGTLPSTFSSTPSNFRREASRFSLLGNQLIHRNSNLPVLKYEDRERVFNEFHRHLGRDRTWKVISSRYYWRGGYQYVCEKVKSCVACAHKNDSIWPAGMPPLKPIKVTPKLMWRMHIDCLGPLTQSLNGNQYVAVAVCAFSKFPEAKGTF